MKKYQFYGWEQADVPATSKTYEKIKNPKELYDILSEIWCADTCAPRMMEQRESNIRTMFYYSISGTGYFRRKSVWDSQTGRKLSLL